MIKRIITDEIKAEAMYNAKILTERNKTMPNKFGVNDTPETRYLGQLGDLSFKYYLIEHKIHFFTWGIIEHSIDEDYDFMLKGSDKKLDMKTYPIKYNTNYILNNNIMYIEKSQTTDENMDYYVGCVLDEWETYAYLRGYILRSDVLNNHKVVNSKNMVTPGYEIPIVYLDDIRGLVFKLTGKLIDEYEIPTSKQHTFMDIDVSTLPKNPGKVKNLSLMDYTSDYMLSLPTKPKVKQTLMDY